MLPAYCTNVVAGRTLEETCSNVERTFGAVRALVSPGAPLPIGLWLSARAVAQLSESIDGPTARAVIEHSESKVVVLGKLDDVARYRDCIPSGIEVVTTPDHQRGDARTWDEVCAMGDPSAVFPTLHPDDLMTIIYTSGTTGMPKGVMHSYRNFQEAFRIILTQFSFLHQEVFLSYLPLCHVAERLMSPVMQLAYGSVVYFAESIDAVTMNLREIGPSYFFGVPRIWEKLQQHIVIASQEARPWVRHVFESAMKVPIPIAQRTIDNGDRAVNWRDAITARLLRWLVFSNLLASVGLDRTWVSMTGGASISPSVILFLGVALLLAIIIMRLKLFTMFVVTDA